MANDRKKHTRIQQVDGDDGYQWCLIVRGRIVYSGMTRSEAVWRRDRYINEGVL